MDKSPITPNNFPETGKLHPDERPPVEEQQPSGTQTGVAAVGKRLRKVFLPRYLRNNDQKRQNDWREFFRLYSLRSLAPSSALADIPPPVFVSQIIGRPIRDSRHDRLGSIHDLIFRLNTDVSEVGEVDATYPPLSGVIARIGRRDLYLPATHIASLEANGVVLSSTRIDLTAFSRRDGEVLLVEDVLDKQLIDLHGRRVIRVNDIEIARTDQYRVVGVDIGGQALLRRVIPGLTIASGNDIIDWSQVQYFASAASEVKLKITHDRLARLHPVEIARLANELSYVQSAEIIEALDDETAADTLVEMDDPSELIERMETERAADLLEEMDPDDAADVLNDLDDETSAELLAHMDPEDASDVKELLPYTEDSAGGLMTNDFATLPVDISVGEGVARLRALAERPAVFYYIYITSAVNSYHLIGVVSIGDLFMAEPETPLAEIINHDIVVAHVNDPGLLVTRLISDYSLLSIPVLDDEQDIVGVVTVEAALELVLPEGWREQLPNT